MSCKFALVFLFLRISTQQPQLSSIRIMSWSKYQPGNGLISTNYYNSIVDNTDSTTFNINGNQIINMPRASFFDKPRSSAMQDASFMDDEPSYDEGYTGPPSSAFPYAQPGPPSRSATSNQHKKTCTFQPYLTSLKMSLEDALLKCNLKSHPTPFGPKPISPWREPHEWIEAHLKHLKDIVQNLGNVFRLGKFGTHLFDGNHLIYPVSFYTSNISHNSTRAQRTIVYLYAHSFHCTGDDRYETYTNPLFSHLNLYHGQPPYQLCRYLRKMEGI